MSAGSGSKYVAGQQFIEKWIKLEKAFKQSKMFNSSHIVCWVINTLMACCFSNNRTRHEHGIVNSVDRIVTSEDRWYVNMAPRVPVKLQSDQIPILHTPLSCYISFNKLT